MNRTVYTVSEITYHVKLLVESDRALADVYVSGFQTTRPTPPATTTSPSRTRRAR